MPRTISLSSLDFAALVRPGERIAWPQGTGEPLALTRRLVEQRGSLKEPKLLIGMQVSDTLQPSTATAFDIMAINAAGTNRRLAAAGLLDMVPANISQLPRLIRAGRLPVDVALIAVRPGPRPGTYSTGMMADYVADLVARARIVVAQLDGVMPLTGGDAVIAADDIDLLVETSGAIVEMHDGEPQGVERDVAARVAELIPDRATVQLGIGGVPIAVARALRHHKHLGIHSGVVPDATVDLVACGAVTGAFKGADAGLIVTGGLFGSRRLAAFADGNAGVSMRSLDYTHAPATLAALSMLHTINSAVEVDLTGQVNAEVAGGRYIGAVGGHADFVRGALVSEGGRSIVALPSATADGRISRIVARLDGPVTTPRADVDRIVTEQGVAELEGCSMSERARRMIAIAHPAFREPLERAAHDMGWLA